MQNEFQLGGHTYRHEPLSRMVMFHAARRIAPALTAFRDFGAAQSAATGILSALSGGGRSGRAMARVGYEALRPLATVIAQLSDQDAEALLRSCLSACFRKVGDDWAPVWLGEAAEPAFEDLDVTRMVMLALIVLRHSLLPLSDRIAA